LSDYKETEPFKNVKLLHNCCHYVFVMLIKLHHNLIKVIYLPWYIAPLKYIQLIKIKIAKFVYKQVCHVNKNGTKSPCYQHLSNDFTVNTCCTGSMPDLLHSFPTKNTYFKCQVSHTYCAM